MSKLKHLLAYLLIFGLLMPPLSSPLVFAQGDTDEAQEEPLDDLPPEEERPVEDRGEAERPANPFRRMPKNPENDREAFKERRSRALERLRAQRRNRTTPTSSRPTSPRSGRGGPSAERPGQGPATLKVGQAKPINFAKSREVVENFDYPNAELLDVAKAISKLTGRNFIYNPQEVKGRISIVSETPITVNDAWKAFLTALDMKGYTVIPSGEYLRIERAQAAKEKQVPIYAGRYAPDTDQYITRIIPLRYINAKDVEQTFRLWIPRQGRMYAYEQTNTLIITDTAAHIKRFMELIRMLDVRGYQESLTVIPIKYADAKNLAKIIEQIIFNSTSSSSSSARRRTPRPRSGNARRRTSTSSSSGNRTGGTSISQIIADERTNSLVVKANKAGLIEVRTLVRKLDTKRAAAQGSGRIHVVRLEFADAEELAKALGAIAKENKPSPTTRRTGSRVGTFAPGNDPLVANIFQGEIKVSPDKATQSLVITASPQDFATMKRVIEQLDVPRDQVFVEAIIMELNLRNDDGFGVSFVNPANGIAFPSDNLFSLIDGIPAGGLSLGFKHGNKIKIGDREVFGLQGLVELLQSTGNSNVLARPQIIAMDNEEAEVEIAETVPQQTRTASTSGGADSFSFKQEKASLLLKITPHINKASDFVRLDVEQTLEEFDNTNTPAEIRGQAIGKRTRSTKTKLIVQNEDTVVMSGLIRETQEERINKVPLLGDIPVLGWLFKNAEFDTVKSDLAIFITPKIIKQYNKIRKVLEQRLSERKDYVQEHLGGNDPNIRYLNKMRASLPSLTNINPRPSGAPTSATIVTPLAPEENEYPEAEFLDNGIPEYEEAPYEEAPAPAPVPVEESPVWKDPGNPGVSGGIPVDPNSGGGNGGDNGGSGSQ